MSVRAITDADFRPQVVDAPIPTLLVFGAEWCGPCREIAPTLDTLAEKYGNQIAIVTMNIDENPLTPGIVEIKGVPALLLFKEGYCLGHKVGNLTEEYLTNWITEEGCLA